MSIPLTFNYDNIVVGNTIYNSDAVLNIDGNINIKNNSYISYGYKYGIFSYGFRDNDGILQFKNNNSDWYNIVSIENLQNNTINGSKILDNSIDISKLYNFNIGGDIIDDNSINGSKIIDNTISNAKLLDATIENNKIKDNTISNAKLLDSTIENDKIKDNTITNAKLLDTTIENNKIKDNTISNAKLLDVTIENNKIKDNTISNAKLLDATIENDKIKDNTIDNVKLIDNNINGSKLLDGTVDIDKLINPNDISKILYGNGTWKVLDTIYNNINIPINDFNINYNNNESNIFNINYNYNIGTFKLSNLDNKFKILISSPDDDNFNITFNSNTYEYLKFNEIISTNKKYINFYSDYFSLSNKSIILNNSKSLGGLEGLIIYDGINEGYIRTSSDLSKYELKIPSMNTNIYLKPHLTQDTTVLIDYNNQYLRQGYLYVDNSFGIDTNNLNNILNIGNDNANVVNIGCSNNNNTINIGTNNGISTINIGYSGDTVNINGSLNYIQTTNLQIYNKIIQINEGSTLPMTARDAGIKIKDNNDDNKGYILTSLTGNYFVLKAPENDYILSTPLLSVNSNVIIDQGNQYINGIISTSSKFIYLNCNSNTNEIVLNAGLYFNKNGVYNAGYLRTSNTGNHFHFKPPNSNYIIQTPTLTINSTILVDNGNQIINGTFLMTDNNGIDTNGDANGNILNIGYNNSKVINIGNHTINAQYTVNIGTGIGVGTINIGSNNDIININGQVNSSQTTNLHVVNKIIVLNDGSTTAQSCRFSGINFRDNDILDAGYILTGDLGNNYIFKAPENNYVLSTPILTANSNILINKGNSSIINGNILFDNNHGIDNKNIGSDNLTIGYSKSIYVKIGNNSTSHIVTIGNSQISNLISNVVDICTDTNTSICNIGSINNTNNIIGTNILSSLNVNDNFIILNKSNELISSLYNSGIKINYNNIEAGYIKTSSDGKYYNIKAPDNSFILTTPTLTINSKILINNGEQIINTGNLKFTNEYGIDNLILGDVLNIGRTNSKYIYIGNSDINAITIVNSRLEVSNNILSTKDITAFGSLTSISDERLKTNIKPIQKNIIYDLIPVQYNWINNKYFNKNGEYDVGFIAQDVEKIAPHLVSNIKDDKGEEYKTLCYEKIVPFLVDEIQKLNNKIKEQEEKINNILKYLNI